MSLSDCWLPPTEGKAEKFQYYRHWLSAHHVSSFYKVLKNVGGRFETQTKQTVLKGYIKISKDYSNIKTVVGLKLLHLKISEELLFRNCIKNYLSYKTAEILLCLLTCLGTRFVTNNY